MRSPAYVRVGTNAAALLAGRAGLLLSGLWLNGQLARTLGVAGLGRYLLALTVEGLALSLVNMGLNVFAVREFSRRDEDEVKALLGTVLGIRIVAAALGIIMLNGAVIPLLFAGPRRAAVTWASLGLLPQALNSAMMALLNGQQRMALSSAIDLLARLAGVLGGFVLLGRGGDERHVLVCYVAGHLLAMVALVVVISAWRLTPCWKGWHRRVRGILHEALPFAGVDVAAILYRRVDLLLLGYWHSDAVVGIYGAAYRVWETLGIAPSSLLDALFPELAKAGAGNRREHLGLLFRRGSAALVALVLIIGGTCLWFAPQLMVLVYGRVSGIETSTRLFRLLVLALPFTYLYLLSGHILYATGQQRRVLGAMAIVTTGNALLNAMLIPVWGIWGAATVAVLAESVLLATLGGAAWREVLSHEASQQLAS